MVGNIASIETMGLVDGPGVRFVLFLQGCPLRCKYCHNPEMWSNKNAPIHLTPEEVVEKVKKYKPYFKNNGGITISGGEPLTQAKFVEEIFALCKENNIHTCLDTSGFGDNYENLLNFCDLVLLDVKELDKQKYKTLTGQNIDKFYSFLNCVQSKNIPLILRQVIVPNYNDNKENILNLKAFASNIKNVIKIELLPYHNMAEKKYEKLGITYTLKGTENMDKTLCKNLEKHLK